MTLNSSKSKYFENFIVYRKFKHKQPVIIACIIYSFVLELHQKPKKEFPFSLNFKF